MNQQLEYLYLSHITSDSQYSDKVILFREALRKLQPLRPSAIDLTTGTWTDSADEKVNRRRENYFYRSLVQVYLQSNGTDLDSMRWYEKAIDALDQNRLIKSWKQGAVFVRSYLHRNSTDLPDFMNTFQCNLAGILALGTKAQIKDLDQIDSLNLEAKANETERILLNNKLAESIADTCHLAANSSRTGLPPERFYFDKDQKATNTGEEEAKDAFYDLRYVKDQRQRNSNISHHSISPELAESYFLLHRLTQDEKYRTYAWELVNAIQKHARTQNGGYLQVQNVNRIPTVKDGTSQPPLFMSATLKYLYLIFSDKLTPLDQWVFNSVGHPLPIIGQVREEL